MENQHKKIVGYRELAEMEIELMNDVKWLEAKFLEAFAVNSIPVTVEKLLDLKTAWNDQLKEIGAMRQAETDSLLEGNVGSLTLEQLNESKRCLNESRRNMKLVSFPVAEMPLSIHAAIEQARMWAVTSIALPDALSVKKEDPIEKSIKELQDEIYTEYSEKGSMAHESITAKLKDVAEIDQAIADEILTTLESRGF